MAESLTELEALERLLREIESEKEAIRHTSTTFRKAQHGSYERLAGREALQAMEDSPIHCEVALQSSNAGLRLVALGVLGERWFSKVRLRHCCERLAIDDPDANVQAAAVTLLSRCYESTRDLKIQRLLATFVQDEARSPMVRLSSYAALFRIEGIQPPPIDWVAEKNIKMPTEVNWSFVRSFLRT